MSVAGGMDGDRPPEPVHFIGLLRLRRAVERTLPATVPVTLKLKGFSSASLLLKLIWPDLVPVTAVSSRTVKVSLAPGARLVLSVVPAESVVCPWKSSVVVAEAVPAPARAVRAAVVTKPSIFRCPMILPFRLMVGMSVWTSHNRRERLRQKHLSM